MPQPSPICCGSANLFNRAMMAARRGAFFFLIWNDFPAPPVPGGVRQSGGGRARWWRRCAAPGRVGASSPSAAGDEARSSRGVSPCSSIGGDRRAQHSGRPLRSRRWRLRAASAHCPASTPAGTAQSPSATAAASTGLATTAAGTNQQVGRSILVYVCLVHLHLCRSGGRDATEHIFFSLRKYATEHMDYWLFDSVMWLIVWTLGRVPRVRPSHGPRPCRANTGHVWLKCENVLMREEWCFDY